MMEDNDSKIPKNVDAEERVLAHCLADGSTDFFDSIAHKIRSDDFYLYKHNLVFTSVSSLAKKGEPLTEISLVEELKLSSTFDDVDGMTMINTLMDKVSGTFSSGATCTNLNNYNAVYNDQDFFLSSLIQVLFSIAFWNHGCSKHSLAVSLLS